MDEFFMGVDDKFSVSMVDSTMMSILHSAMNKAHAKVQSKDGVIERLNEQSKFYELAIMQLEACLKFVQEEAGNYILETTHKRLLFDLLEMKDKLEKRLKETEAAIIEKDKELLERLENETRLRQTLEAKEQELQCYKKSIDHTKDGNFNELMHSVDKHVYNIKQHLEVERIALTKRLSKEISPSTIVESLNHIDVTKSHHVTKRENIFDPIKGTKSELEYDQELDMGFGQMGLEVDSLKKTLDSTFEITSSIISRYNDHPLEVQWAWRIEKDILSILLKNFVVNQIEDLHVKAKLGENKSVSIGPLCIQTCSNFIDNMTLLQDELEGMVLSYEAREKHWLHHDTYYGVLMHDDNLRNFVDKEFQEAKSRLEIIPCFENNYESKIRKSLKKVLQRMDDFRTWIIRLDPSISNNGLRYKRMKCSTRDEKNEKEFENRHLIAQHHYEVEQHMKKLNLQFFGAKNTTRLTKDFDIRLDDHIVENLIKEAIQMKLVNETIRNVNLCRKKFSNESSNLLEECAFQSDMKEGILCQFLKTVFHDFKTRSKGDCSLLTKKQEHFDGYGGDVSSMEQQISKSNSHLQKINHEEVKTGFWKEMPNLWTSKDSYEEHESSIRESIQWCIISEAIKHLELYDIKNPKFTHVKKVESSIEELDSLLSYSKSEKILISKSKDETGYLNHICIEVEDVLDKTYEELKTLHRTGNDDMKKSDKLNYNIREKPLLSYGSRQMVDHPAILFDHDFLFIQEFHDQMINLEVMLQEKLNVTNLRLEKLNNQLKPLIHQITSHNREKSVYKTAFKLRCQNLQKAEIEVDVLGDTVDALTTLLKRIY